MSVNKRVESPPLLSFRPCELDMSSYAMTLARVCLILLFLQCIRHLTRTGRSFRWWTLTDPSLAYHMVNDTSGRG